MNKIISNATDVFLHDGLISLQQLLDNNDSLIVKTFFKGLSDKIKATSLHANRSLIMKTACFMILKNNLMPYKKSILTEFLSAQNELKDLNKVLTSKNNQIDAHRAITLTNGIIDAKAIQLGIVNCSLKAMKNLMKSNFSVKYKLTHFSKTPLSGTLTLGFKKTGLKKDFNFYERFIEQLNIEISNYNIPDAKFNKIPIIAQNHHDIDKRFFYITVSQQEECFEHPCYEESISTIFDDMPFSNQKEKEDLYLYLHTFGIAFDEEKKSVKTNVFFGNNDDACNCIDCIKFKRDKKNHAHKNYSKTNILPSNASNEQKKRSQREDLRELSQLISKIKGLTIRHHCEIVKAANEIERFSLPSSRFYLCIERT